jgi:hypothetical protein
LDASDTGQLVADTADLLFQSAIGKIASAATPHEWSSLLASPFRIANESGRLECMIPTSQEQGNRP